MSFTLQYASNFFLNLHKRRDFKNMLIPCSENLALLGNICNVDTNENIRTYESFLNYCSKNYKKVYLVPGVWEMGSKTPLLYDNCMYNLYSLTKPYKNISILNNTQTYNSTICIVGTPLWVCFPYLKHQCMYEYNYIWLKRHSSLGQITGHDIVNWHLEDIQFIKDTVKGNKTKTIVLTHHMPDDIFTDNIYRKRMEGTNLVKHIKKPIEIWLGGACDRSISGTTGLSRDVFCAVNPYTTFSKAPQDISASYNPEAYVSLKTDYHQLS